MGNIFTAFKNRTPLVITAGQQARSILPFDPFLASNQATELPKPYVKWSIEPARAQDVPLALARAYHIAMQEPRGPVFVSATAHVVVVALVYFGLPKFLEPKDMEDTPIVVELVEIAGSDHHVTLDNPAAFVDAVNAFLQRHT